MNNQVLNIVPTVAAGVQTTVSAKQLHHMTAGHQILSDRAEELACNALYYLATSGQVDMLNHVTYWVKAMPVKDTKLAAVRLIGIMLSKESLFVKDKDTKKFSGGVKNKLLWQWLRTTADNITDGTVEQFCERLLTAAIDAGLITIAADDDAPEKTDAQKLADKMVPKSFAGMQKYSASIQSHLKAIYLEAYQTVWTGK